VRPSVNTDIMHRGCFLEKGVQNAKDRPFHLLTLSIIRYNDYGQVQGSICS
jgi:hypothetical protein